MREAEFQAIREIAREMGQDAAGAEFLRLAGRSSDAVPDEIREDLNSLRDVTPQRDSAAGRDAETELQPMLALADLGLAQLSHLAVLCPHPFESKDSFLWPDDETDHRGPGGALVLTFLVTHLANTLVGIRTLVCSGLDAQARILLRAYVEVADITVAVLGDRDTFRAYTSLARDPAAFARMWKGLLSPERIRRVLSSLETEIALEDEVRVKMAAMRRETYEWLSSVAHGQGLALFLGAFQPTVEDPDVLRFSLMGSVTPASKTTLLRAVLYTWQLLMYAIRLLWDKHRWRFGLDVNDKDNRWFFVRHHVFTQLFLSRYERMQDDLKALWRGEEPEDSQQPRPSGA